ncbi:unnamed protein product [Calicophoron daubneyi]|uniref:Transmembrane protein 216 n=1 Tax=Calicophoron daubneyi TaxID=300641 RepID=A0AAV2TVG4_CALDB
MPTRVSSCALGGSLRASLYITIAFVFFETFLFVYKVYNHKFGSGVLVEEILVLLSWSATELGRIFLAFIGLYSSEASVSASSLFFYIPSVLGVVFFLLWQSFVLRLEQIVSYFVLSVYCLQFVLHIGALVGGKRKIRFD